MAKIKSTMRKLILLLIRGYQILLSPFFGQHCRFYPSCSHYTHEAISRYGTLRGTVLGVKRICRCHPWNPGGFDPVPDLQTTNLKSKN